MKNRNEEIFKDNLVVVDYLICEYKKELSKPVQKYGSGKYKATSKSRHHSLRLEINNALKYIEDDLPYNFFCEVD